jgi:hypothetical protein
LKIKILEWAKQDLSEGFGFYESQKSVLKATKYLPNFFRFAEVGNCVGNGIVSIRKEKILKY